MARQQHSVGQAPCPASTGQDAPTAMQCDSPRTTDSQSISKPRRRFLRQISALAAAPGLLAGLESRAAQTQAAAKPLPTIQLGPHEISRLVAGSNPLNGYSYLGPHVDKHMKEYFTPDRVIEFLENCQRQGITAHQLSTRGASSDVLPILRDRGSTLKIICLHSDSKKVKDAADAVKPTALVHHGGVTDKLFSQGKSSEVHDFVKAAHDCGVLAGVSAHNPDCIKRVADEGWQVDFFMTCFYFLTRHTLQGGAAHDSPLPLLEVSYPFYKDDPLTMTKVIREVSQPCLAFKILAAGRRCASQDEVRAAFRFAFENIKPTDGVIVGMFPWNFDEISANVQYTHEFGKNG